MLNCPFLGGKILFVTEAENGSPASTHQTSNFIPHILSSHVERSDSVYLRGLWTVYLLLRVKNITGS